MSATLRHLVLAGGGHAHVEVLRQLAALPAREARVTVVSPEAHAPYSGMLPGLIAGHYTWAECHIALAELCQRCGAELVLAAVAAVDPEKKVVLLSDGRTIEWDLLSLNTGSTTGSWSRCAPMQCASPTVRRSAPPRIPRCSPRATSPASRRGRCPRRESSPCARDPCSRRTSFVCFGARRP